MAIQLDNPSGNIITITNNDLVNPVLYTIYKLNSSQLFEIVINYPIDPTLVLAAGANISLDMVSDNVYKLIIAGTPNIEYYFLLDANIRDCEKAYLKSYLCEACGCCDSIEHLKHIYDVIKFNAIRDRIYYIWNKWVQTQSIVDLIGPDSAEIMYLGDLTSQLAKLCTNCDTDNCNNCGRSINIQNSDLTCLDC